MVGVGALFFLNGIVGIFIQSWFINKAGAPPQIDMTSIAENTGFLPKSQEQYLLIKEHVPFLIFVIRLQEALYFVLIFLFAALLALRSIS